MDAHENRVRDLLRMSDMQYKITLIRAVDHQSRRILVALSDPRVARLTAHVARDLVYASDGPDTSRRDTARNARRRRWLEQWLPSLERIIERCDQ